MSIVKDVDKIDLITYSEQEKKVTLVMVEPRKWCSDSKMYEELNQKINNYLTFIEDGQLEEQYCDKEINLIKIEVLSEHNLTDHGNMVISAMEDYLHNNGYQFEFRIVNSKMN